MAHISNTPPAAELNAGRLAVAGAIALPAIVAMCWVGGVFVPEAPQRFIRLFTSVPTTHVLALMEGMGFASVFGAIGGGLLGGLYNATHFIGRRLAGDVS